MGLILKARSTLIVLYLSMCSGPRLEKHLGIHEKAEYLIEPRQNTCMNT